MTTAILAEKESATITAMPAPFVLRMGFGPSLTNDQLFEFCRKNRDWRIERDADGDLLIMSPTGGETGKRNLELLIVLGIWAKHDRTGVAFDSSTGFILSSGAMRSPDASWVLRSRIDQLTAEEKKKFLPLCPDFVVELRSPSDSLSTVEAKMDEWIDNGSRLGFLIDPKRRSVTVYRPGSDPEILEDPVEVSGESVLPGFVLELRDVWEAL